MHDNTETNSRRWLAVRLSSKSNCKPYTIVVVLSESLVDNQSEQGACLERSMRVFEKLGGAAIIAGSLLLRAYAVLFPILLPLGTGTFDYAVVVRSPGWVSLAVVAFVGVLALLVGFYAVYAKMRATGGLQGSVGFVFVEAAYLLHACKVTWELFHYPVIARCLETAFLL